MKTNKTRLAPFLIFTLILSARSAYAEVLPLFTEDLDAFDARADLGDGELHGVEIIPEAESPFNDGNAFRIYDFNPDDKPELQGEFFEPLEDPFRIDFQSFNQSVNESSSAIRFRMANTGKNISSESRVAFSLSWQADSRLTAKYEREDGTVGTLGTFLSPQTVADITLVANPNGDDSYSYTLFDETRTLNTTSYDVFVDGFLLSADFENGMPFHLTRSEAEFDPFLGLSRFGLIGSSNANVDPDYLFDNIILRTGDDIATEVETPIKGDTNLDGTIDASDIDLLSKAVRDGTVEARFDINDDGGVDDADRVELVTGILGTWIGDSDLNGEFNSGDFVQVFSFGEYEDGIAENSTWATGDWSGDADFTSGDFVAAFVDGGYEKGQRTAAAAVPEPSSLLMLLVAALMTFSRVHQARKTRCA